MRRCVVGMTVCICLLAGGAVAADQADPQAKVPPFFVATITTDVHRSLLSNQEGVYAIVNCDALLKGTRFDPPAEVLKDLAAALKRVAVADASNLRMMLRYQHTTQTEDATREAIVAKLKEIGRSAGFRSVKTTEMYTSAIWSDQWGVVEGFEESPGAREPIVDDALVRVYPVRTKLSKMLVGNVDCVVEIKRPIDGRRQEIGADVQQAIERGVQKLQLGPRKGKLRYDVSSTNAGQPLVEQWFDSRPPPKLPAGEDDPALKQIFEEMAARYKPSPGMKLAIDLGFETSTYSHSPGGGAPEKLIGQRVPNFTLESLAGEKVELQTLLGNRPALITFWGVACGPCRREAPHLTAMHEKYRDEFAIVAVNGYDESREVVARYVEEARLTHPIVIGGGTVANKDYRVGAYPTTFWISREGTVVDYEVDFASAEALERRIKDSVGRQ